MEVLNSNFFLAICISLVHYILKIVIEKNRDFKKRIFKDSILVGIVAYAVLIFRSNFISFESARATTVFTNAPQF
uniref:Uncharacterized protein n=1 Tax=viral metagenome TaxID=1070528 RepID=A0A6C0KXQ7_9ZZZZ